MEIDQATLSYIIGAVETAVPVIVSVVAVSKAKIKEQKWKLLQQIANEAMSHVEEYQKQHGGIGIDGAQKLQMALNETEISAKAAGISWNDTIKAQVTEYITEMCAWAKTVNAE